MSFPAAPRAAVVVLCLLAGPLLAQYGGGNGSPFAPFQILTPEHMNTIGTRPQDWSMQFVLENDLDMSAYPGDLYNIIGNYVTAFTGVFDGNGHVISDLTYENAAAAGPVGLFGRTGAGAVISNLTLENCHFTTTYAPGETAAPVGLLIGATRESTITNCQAVGSISVTSNSARLYIGGLVGLIDRGATFTGCHADVDITASTFTRPCTVGGLVGLFDDPGSITACTTDGSISAYSSNDCQAGGLCGYLTQVNVANCQSRATVQLAAAGVDCLAGGLAGYLEDAWVQNSQSTGDVNASAANGDCHAGGFAGWSWSNTIENCDASGNTDAQASDLCRAGAFAGYQYAGSVSESRADGDVDAESLYDHCHAGGFIGVLYVQSAQLNRCCSTGSVEAQAALDCFAGGMVGYQYRSAITDCYSTSPVNIFTPSNSWDGCVGGLVGNHYGSAAIVNCYSAGHVSGAAPNLFDGGLVGRHEAGASTYTAAFWDTQTSGLNTSAGDAGVQPKTTAEMTALATYTDAGWDFTNTWSLRCPGMNYPRLQWQPLLPGDTACPNGIGLEELAALNEYWLVNYEPMDLIDDNIINLLDFAILNQQWLWDRQQKKAGQK